MNRHLIAVVLAFGALPAQADDLTTFLSGYGCVIGPETYTEAEAHGLDTDALREIETQARDGGQGEQHGDWFLLDSALCQITIPPITSRITWDDPDLGLMINPLDSEGPLYTDYTELIEKPWPTPTGCYIVDTRSLQRARDWSDELWEHEYRAFLAEGFRTGRLSFYSEDWFMTPDAVAVIDREGCDNPDAITEIRTHIDYLQNATDQVIRAVGADTPCDEAPDIPIHMPPFGSHKTSNVWIGFELRLMAVSAGWANLDGAFVGARRPPLCHYAD